MKRIALFLLTNVAVMVVLGLVVNIFGLNPEESYCPRGRPVGG